MEKSTAASGVGLAGGNIQFGPNNYVPATSAGAPNASGEVYHFGVGLL
jgi:hypothetical protein